MENKKKSPKELEQELNAQKTANQLADLINNFINFSELEIKVRNLFNTKEMYELINFISEGILREFFPEKKDEKTNEQKPE